MVYIDKLFTWSPRTAQACRHGCRWCHLWADNPEELLQFGRRIGLKPKYIQRSEKFIHFDLTPAKRKLAIIFGAKESDLKEFLEI